MSDNGRIHITLDEATIAEVLALVAQIKAKLPFLIRLASDEKQGMAKARAGSEEVADKVLGLQEEAGMPVAPDDPLVADLSVYRGLTQIGDEISDVQTLIEDTKFLAGSEAWSESLIRYGMLRQKARSKPQLLDKVNRLRPLIAPRRARKPAPPETTPETPEDTEE